MSETNDLKSRPCWISAQGSTTLRQCTLFALSDCGATISSASALPDTFDLYVTLDSKVGRRCRTISRFGREVGVEFLPED